MTNETKPKDAEPIGYAEAMTELNAILAQLDADNVDVDRLSGLVRRAGELLVFCRQRITQTRLDIDRIVSDLGERPDKRDRGSSGTSEMDPWP